MPPPFVYQGLGLNKDTSRPESEIQGRHTHGDGVSRWELRHGIFCWRWHTVDAGAACEMSVVADF